jgi:hypothetical protein
MVCWGAIWVIVSVVLIVVVETDVAVAGATTTVSGVPVTMVVIVLLTVTETRQSTRWMNLRSKLETLPFLSTMKPPVLLAAVWRLKRLTACPSRPSMLRLARELEVGTAEPAAERAMKPAGVATTIGSGIDVVVVMIVVVVVSMSVNVVASGVS